MSEPMTLRAEDLTFAYDEDPVVADVSLSVGPGELVAVIGPNGSGKSTLLRLLLGQRSAQTGRVLLGGRPLAAMNRRDVAAAMALVPQASAAPFGYSVREVVLMARYHAHQAWGGVLPTFETADDFRIADEAMWAMDVHHLAARPVTTLSGGERQRVLIARALAQKSPIVLLDEPTSALDLHHQLELFATMQDLARAGKAVLWVTHDIAAARRVSPRTIVMDQGRVVADGASSDVLTPGVLEPVYRVRVAVTAEGLQFSRRTSAEGAR